MTISFHVVTVLVYPQMRHCVRLSVGEVESIVAIDGFSWVVKLE